MTIRMLAEALDEARETSLWYEGQQPGLGEGFADALSVTLEEIVRHPRLFARREGVGSAREIRSASLDRYPYDVVYEVRPDEIVVLAVAHARRRPNYWKHRRG